MWSYSRTSCSSVHGHKQWGDILHNPRIHQITRLLHQTKLTHLLFTLSLIHDSRESIVAHHTILWIFILNFSFRLSGLSSHWSNHLHDSLCLLNLCVPFLPPFLVESEKISKFLLLFKHIVSCRETDHFWISLLAQLDLTKQTKVEDPLLLNKLNQKVWDTSSL